MNVVRLDDIALHYRDEGNRDGPSIVFSNSLGTDLRLWDKVVPEFLNKYRVIRYDKRGHGLSECPPAPYKMGKLIHDAERLIEHLDAGPCVFVGLSIGGLTAQGLAAKRPDLLRALVLSNTGLKIGNQVLWDERIATANSRGVGALADGVMQRWFGKNFLASDEVLAWREMLSATRADGYAGCCAAIAGADFFSTSASLELPALVIGGSEDGATPPDMTRELANHIPEAQFQLIQGAGHLACVDKPLEYITILREFLDQLE